MLIARTFAFQVTNALWVPLRPGSVCPPPDCKHVICTRGVNAPPHEILKVGLEPGVTQSASRASACPGWAMLPYVHATLFLNYDKSYRGNTQPHQIAYPPHQRCAADRRHALGMTGGQAMARRLRLVPGPGASDRRHKLPLDVPRAVLASYKTPDEATPLHVVECTPTSSRCGGHLPMILRPRNRPT